MKTAFKILPEISSQKDYDLLIELGRGGLSMTWYTRSPLHIEGLFIYHAEKNADDSALATDLQRMLASEALPPYRSCRICYNFKEGMLVPDAFYSESTRAAMMDDVYGADPTAKYYAETLYGINARYVYRVPQAIDEAIHNRFFNAAVFHTNACLIAAEKQADLYCVIYNSYIKCIVRNNGQLQLVQSYDYQTPSDVAYHLLNICRQHELSPETATLTLSGFIDRQSNLYEEIYRYFLHVELDEFPAEAGLAEEIKAYPSHFFSYLVNLIQCAS
ncbi:MAG: DUF3822 family protein [Ferruginibacter sp.]